MVDGYEVLKENNYDMETGMKHEKPSAPAAPAPRRKLQRAGTDYSHVDHCMVCWDGGDLVCCDHCPCSYHPECLGMTLAEIMRMKWW